MSSAIDYRLNVIQEHKANVIFQIVCDVLNVTKKEIRSRSRKMQYVWARQMFVYFAYHIVECHIVSLKKFVPRNRTTLLYHIRHFEDSYKYDLRFRELANKVKHETQEHNIIRGENT